MPKRVTYNRFPYLHPQNSNARRSSTARTFESEAMRYSSPFPAACLVGYWALLRFVPVPGAGIPGRDIPFMDQIGGMVLFGTLGMVGGEIWDWWFPINKNLWTSSLVLFSGGFALLLVSLLYWMVEVKRWRGAWTMPILVFGMNRQPARACEGAAQP